MTFKIRCPNCPATYTAETQWVGKRTRCKKCGDTFVIEEPADEVSLPDPDEPTTRVAKAEIPNDLSDLAATLGEKRPGTPERDSHSSPIRVAIESKLRLGLILVAISWSAFQTFRENQTGLVRIALLRFGAVALLYLLLVVPLISQSVTASLRRRRQKLPVNSRSRVAATFALPASLGFVSWQVHGTVGSFTVWLIVGLALMAGMFWIQFRGSLLQTGNAYGRASVWFFTAMLLSALTLVGVNFAINRVMIEAHSVAFKESPLGRRLAWTTPEAGQPEPSDSSVAGNAAHPPTTRVAKVPRSTVFDPIFTAQSPAMPGASTATTKRGSGALFVNPDDDQFLADLQKNNQPWIKQISRPAGQSPFDFIVVPSDASPYIGFVSMDANSPAVRRFGVGLAIDTRIRRAASFDITDDANPHAFPHDYLLSSDGTVLLHLKGATIEIISAGTNRRDTFPLTIPEQLVKAALVPELVGLARDQSVVIRWTGVDATDQIVQRYSYANRMLVNSGELHDAALAAETSTVSTNATGPVWLASIVTPTHQRSSLGLFNVTSAHGDMRTTALPSGVLDLTNYDHVELAFSPDASKIVLMLTDGEHAMVYMWKLDAPSAPSLKVALPMMPPAMAPAHVVGPRIRWIDQQAFLVDGQAVVSTVPKQSGMIGIVSETPAMAATTIGADHVLLSYLGADGLCHLAEVEFDAAALREAMPVKELPASSN